MNDRKGEVPYEMIGLKGGNKKVFETQLAWLDQAPMPTLTEISRNIKTIPEKQLVPITTDQSDMIESWGLTPPLSFQYAEKMQTFVQRGEGLDQDLASMFKMELRQQQDKYPRGSIIIINLEMPPKPENQRPAKVIDYYTRGTEDIEKLRLHFGTKKPATHFRPFELLVMLPGPQFKRVSMSYISELPRIEPYPEE